MQEKPKTIMEGVTFSRALDAAVAGCRIARVGWNGKGMWVCVGRGGIVSHEMLWNRHTQAFAETQPTGSAEVLPYLIMKTADDKILLGWLASQTDMLATDWQVLA